MRHDEARQLFAILKDLPLETISPCLNLGSQTRHYREKHKPHIHENLFRPLEQKGVKLLHADLQSGDGIDVSGDFMDAEVQQKLLAFNPRLVLCNNMFEHVKDRAELARVLMRLAGDGYLLLSVPHSYPYHPDPIDTRYRPTPEQLAELFPGYDIEHASVVISDTFLADQRRRGKNPIKTLARMAVRLMMPFHKPKYWLSNLHRLTWLKRPYKVTLLMLKVPAGRRH